MAGRALVPVANYPDGFRHLSFPITGTYVSRWLFVTQTNIVVDKVQMWYSTKSSVGSLTAKLVWGASGEAIASSSSLTDITGTLAMDSDSYVNIPGSLTVSTSANLVASGKLIGVKFSGETTSALVGLTVNVWFREGRIN